MFDNEFSGTIVDGESADKAIALATNWAVQMENLLADAPDSAYTREPSWGEWHFWILRLGATTLRLKLQVPPMPVGRVGLAWSLLEVNGSYGSMHVSVGCAFVKRLLALDVTPVVPSAPIPADKLYRQRVR